MREFEPYSREELKRRMRWSITNKSPPLATIARQIEIGHQDLFGFLAGRRDLSNMWVRILTDFYQKWDAGFWVLEKGKLKKAKDPKPRMMMTVDWGTGKLTLKPPAQVMGVKPSTWLPNALSRLEMLGSSESICVSPTGHLRHTKKSARKDVPR